MGRLLLPVVLGPTKRKRVLVLTAVAIALIAALPLVWNVHAVTGVVRDAAGRPLPNAVVRIKAIGIATHTDAAGRFTLAGFTPTLRVRVTAWRDGYYVGGANAWPWASNIRITLLPYAVPDNSVYPWIPPAVKTRSTAEEWPIQVGLSLAARISFDKLFLPLANHLTLGCRDCHRDVYDQWAASAHALGAHNVRFMTLYNGTDVNGAQSPPTRYAHHRDYGRLPLPPDPRQPYYGPGFKLDFPEGAGNCAACHLPTSATEDPYGSDPNDAAGVDTQGTHCDFCHKIAAVKLDPATARPRENMPGVLSIELMRPAPEPQLFFGPYDDVDVGPDTYLPLMKQSEICAPCHTASFWGVPIYQSFAEWQASPYPAEGKTCQSCHMKPDGVTTNFAPGRGVLARDPQTIPTHTFPGASDEALLHNTAELTLSAQWQDKQIGVEVKVTNTGAGHHIPTDSPLRQIFLVVTATDGRGQPLPLQAGPTLPDWAGDLAGKPGVYFAKVLRQRWTGSMPTVAYWTPTRLVEDTRLPARATHISRYTFMSPHSGEVSVEARLIFRRAYYALMQQKGWDVSDIVMENRIVAIPPQ